MYGQRLFIVVLQKLHCLPNCLHVIIIRVILHKVSSSAPSGFGDSYMYCLRVFIVVFYKNYIVKCMCIPSFILIGFYVSELHAHLSPYRNVWPEVIYCCFIYKNYNVYNVVYMLIS